MKIIQVKTKIQIKNIKRLFIEYEEYLTVNLCFQNFEQELTELPGEYSPPNGALLLASNGKLIAGCIALRKLENKICEMKRLYVKSKFRGQGLGRKLATHIITEAKNKGYSLIRLDTLANMKEAMRLYESLGFKIIEPYYDNLLPDVVFLELELWNSDVVTL